MYAIYKDLTKENVLHAVTTYNIFKRYCIGFEQVGKAFKSPLRTDDKRPSAYIIYYDGDLLFKDFGKGSYRAISFVMEHFKLSFREALQKINCDFNLGLGGPKSLNIGFKLNIFKTPEFDEKKSSIINIKRREFNENDIKYWDQYNIRQATLSNFNVAAISNFTINDYLYFSDKLSFVYNYYWENSIYRRKIYQPLSYNKWFSNGGAIVQGEGMLPKEGDLLIITSSLKDVMCLYELGYIAIAPTSETSFVPDTYFIKQNSRFKRILLFMDSDKTGIEANKRLSDKWKLDYIIIPEGYQSKDISDMVKNNGKETAIKLLYETCNMY
jgi:hypothetical protein